MPIIKFLILTSFLSILVGCANSRYQNLDDITNKADCEYLERDLTNKWEDRVYFCLPENYKKDVRVIKPISKTPETDSK